MTERDKEELRELSTRLMGLEMNFKKIIGDIQEQITKIGPMRAVIHNIVNREEIKNMEY
jgi:hypothetical protein